MWHSTPDRIALMQMLLLLKVELLVSSRLFVYVFLLTIGNEISFSHYDFLPSRNSEFCMWFFFSRAMELF